MHCSTLQHAPTCCITLQQTALHCNTLKHAATTLQYTAGHCSPHSFTHTRATYCNTRMQHIMRLFACHPLQHTNATHERNTQMQHTTRLFECNTLQHTIATLCLQHTATHERNTLHDSLHATHCNTRMQDTVRLFACNTLQHTNTATHEHCNTLTLQHTNAKYYKNLSLTLWRGGLCTFSIKTVENVHTATHCNTLQHTAALYNTLQHTKS